MDNNQFLFRRANINDVNALSQLCHKTTRETFVEDLSIEYSPNDLNSYLCSWGSSQWFVTNINDPDQVTWVIEDQTNDDLVAYGVVGPFTVDDIPYSDVQSNEDGIINRLFVRRDRQKYGFGQQLINVMLLWLDEHYPNRPIWLSVFSTNYKAQKFYSHYNFIKVGEYDYPVGESINREFIMKRHIHT